MNNVLGEVVLLALQSALAKTRKDRFGRGCPRGNRGERNLEVKHKIRRQPRTCGRATVRRMMHEQLTREKTRHNRYRVRTRHGRPRPSTSSNWGSRFLLVLLRHKTLLDTVIAEPQTGWNRLETYALIVVQRVTREIHPVAKNKILIVSGTLTFLTQIQRNFRCLRRVLVLAYAIALLEFHTLDQLPVRRPVLSGHPESVLTLRA